VARETVGVIGGGALGLAAALRLAQGGRKVVLIEAEPRLGGLAAGFRPGDDSQATLEKFYHHVFRSDTALLRIVDELGLTHRLAWSRPTTTSLRGGKVYRLPLDLPRLAEVPWSEKLRFLGFLAAMKLTPSERPFAGQSAAAFCRRWMGPHAYAALVEPLLANKFAGRAEEITMGWLWSRFHDRSLALGYLRGGFQLLYDALGAEIERLGGQILLGARATAIRSCSGSVEVETENHGALRCKQLLVTAPQQVFERLAQGLPAGFSRRFPGPEMFSAHVAILALDRPLQDQYWISISDPGYPFLVLVEQTNFVPAHEYGGRHLLYLGNYLPPDHPLLRASDAAVLDQFLPHLARFNPAFDRSWLREHWIFRAPYAQPVVTRGYLRTLPPFNPLPDVYLATMAHVYPQDRGQSASMALGERMAHRMLTV
jgi:protoporphyrinogen oxidase